jgi:hypothetical protein
VIEKLESEVWNIRTAAISLLRLRRSPTRRCAGPSTNASDAESRRRYTAALSTRMSRDSRPPLGAAGLVVARLRHLAHQRGAAGGLRSLDPQSIKACCRSEVLRRRLSLSADHVEDPDRFMGLRDRDQRQLFYEFNLDDVIPKNHLLRRMNVFVTTAAKTIGLALPPSTPSGRRPLDCGVDSCTCRRSWRKR